MIWAWLTKVPKYALVFGLIVLSTVGFYIWRVTYRARHFLDGLNKPGVVEDVRPKMAKVEANHEHMLLVDNDLYDLNGGGLIFRNWLKEGMPAKLFWEAESKTMLAQYERGFVRYKLDGTEATAMPEKYPFGIADDYKWIVFARDKDIWRADMDWKALKLTNEKRVTSIGQFNDQNFARDIVIGTEKTLLIRQLNKVLHVNFATGDVKPMQISLIDINKRRSPDSKGVVGLENGRFYFYNVDTDEAKYFPVGRGAINDYQWLGNDRCAAIAGGTRVVLYDRRQNTLKEVVTLSTQCSKIGEPSPDGRFVFCYSWKGGDLVDVEKKTATPFKGGAGISWVSSDTFAFSREVPDSDLRGTWLQKVGEGERRVSPEPYLVGKAGGFIVPLPSGEQVVFATKRGIAKMKPNGSQLVEVVRSVHAPERVLAIQDWKQ
jgi:hypothetical protein